MILRTIRRSIQTNAIDFSKIKPTNLKGKSVSSQKWLTRQFADPFVQMAKMKNYRCRSAFKLIEMNDRVNILSPGKTVIDCGASPGSWTQIAVDKTNSNGKIANQPKGFVIGIDILNIYPIDGAHIIGNADLRDPKTHEKIVTLLANRKIDCVLSDMAPNATGVRSLDQENIMVLCYTVFRFAVMMSSPDASLLMKIWDNGEMGKLETNLLRFYKNVKFLKPKASRTDSSENFILATGFYGLKTNNGNDSNQNNVSNDNCDNKNTE